MLLANTQYTREQIVQWHKGFIKDCPSGQLDKKVSSKLTLITNAVKNAWEKLIIVKDVLFCYKKFLPHIKDVI